MRLEFTESCGCCVEFNVRGFSERVDGSSAIALIGLYAGRMLETLSMSKLRE